MVEKQDQEGKKAWNKYFDCEELARLEIETKSFTRMWSCFVFHLIH